MANKLTLENILKTYTSDKEWVRTKVEEHADYPEHTNECGVCNKMRQLTDNAEQAILQWVADDFDMSVLNDVYGKGDEARVAVGQAKANYEAQRRQILKAHGWKG